VLKATAEATSMNIVSDSFAVVLNYFQPNAKEQEMVNFFDTIAVAYDCN